MMDMCGITVERRKSANGVGFLVNKDAKHSIIGCCQVSSRVISI